jgi:hypothetical protein
MNTSPTRKEQELNNANVSDDALGGKDYKSIVIYCSTPCWKLILICLNIG